MANFLVVDDSMVARKLIIKIINSTGHKVVAEASSGENSILEYEKHKPDIVTMDMDMPGIGGIESAKLILKKYKNANIIIITAHDNSDLSEYSDFEHKNIVKKPVQKDVMINVINNILKNNTSSKSIVTESLIDKKAKPISQENTKEENDGSEKLENLFKGLDINVGNNVSISHYSGINPFKSVIVAIEPYLLTLKLSKDFAVFNLFEYDPVVVGFNIDNNVYLSECLIKSIDSTTSTFKVNVVSMFSTENNRLFERFPVSLYIDIRDKNRGKNIAIIKNISFTGMAFVSKNDFIIGQIISFDFFMNSNVLQLDAEIVWKKSFSNYNEYGIRTIYRDLSSIESIKVYLQVLRKEQEDIIRKSTI